MDMVGEKEGSKTRIAELLDVLNFLPLQLSKVTSKYVILCFLFDHIRTFFQSGGKIFSSLQLVLLEHDAKFTDIWTSIITF